MSSSYQNLLDAFAFQPFARIAARRAGLEADLFEAEAAGLARFVRNATPQEGAYQGEYDIFRMLA